MKKIYTMMLIGLCLLISACNASNKATINNPGRIKTNKNKIISIYDSKDEITKVLGVPTDKYGVSEYEDGITITFDRLVENSNEIMVSTIIHSDNFETYKGIKVGDNWNLVKAALGLQNVNFEYIWSIWVDQDGEIIGPINEDEAHNWDRNAVQEDWTRITYFISNNKIYAIDIFSYEGTLR